MLKKTFMIISIVTALSTANAASLAFKPIITENDSAEVLKLIDRVCADSWCSGDYDYKFSTFSCNDSSAACILTFKIIDRDAKPGEVNSKNKRCIFKGLTTSEMIFHENKLDEEFYDKLNYCVSDRESRF
jgi:hypothetical protein